MTILIILLVLSLLVAGGFLMAFLWAVRDGQYDDDYSPAVRILFEEEIKNPNRNDEESDTNH